MDATQLRIAARGGAGSARRPRRWHVGAADPAHRASECARRADLVSRRRIEASDQDATEAALRETEEEVGLTRDHVTVIGRLDTYVTGTGFEITPLVGIIEVPFPLALDPFEVSEVFEVPLSFVLDPSNHRRMTRVFDERTRTFFVLPYENRYIWGATAGMLVNLAEVLAG